MDIKECIAIKIAGAIGMDRDGCIGLNPFWTVIVARTSPKYNPLFRLPEVVTLNLNEIKWDTSFFGVPSTKATLSFGI